MSEIKGELIAMQMNLGLGHYGEILITTQERVDNNQVPIAKDVDGASIANELIRRCNSQPDLLEACKNSPAPNIIAVFAIFAEECSEKPSMAIYKGTFITLATFLRSCVDRAEKTVAAIAKAEQS